MRAVHFSDLDAAARALLAQPETSRSKVCRLMFCEAELADRFVRKVGRLHPTWGNGTLRDAAARRGQKGRARFDDPGYASCFQAVLRALHDRPRSTHL